MDLEKASRLSTKIDNLVTKITTQEKNKNILENMYELEILSKCKGQRISFTINEHKFVRIDNPSVKVFKTLLLQEIDEQIAVFEKELDELIKKGIEE